MLEACLEPIYAMKWAPVRCQSAKLRVRLEYIFRPAFILNSSEQHDLYRIIGKNKEYVCTLTSGKYAVLHLWPQFVSLEIRGGVNNASMEFYAEADRSYYVSHEVKASLGTKLRSKLYLVSSEEGERLLRTKIAGKCFKKYKQIKGDQ